MFVVALAEIAGDGDADVARLAEALGSAPYDVKLWVRSGLPRIVFHTAEQAEGHAVVARLRELACRAFVVDMSEVVAIADMVRLTRFAWDETTLAADKDAGPRIAFSDIVALIHVAQRTTLERTVITRVRGGEYETVDREHTTHERLMQNALYMIPRDGGPPWVMREDEAQFIALGTSMRPTRHENFRAAVAMLRERAPAAIYDDRLTKRLLVSYDLRRSDGLERDVPARTDTSVDVIVHVLAAALTQSRGGPYRSAESRS